MGDPHHEEPLEILSRLLVLTMLHQSARWKQVKHLNRHCSTIVFPVSNDQVIIQCRMAALVLESSKWSNLVGFALYHIGGFRNTDACVLNQRRWSTCTDTNTSYGVVVFAVHYPCEFIFIRLNLAQIDASKQDCCWIILQRHQGFQNCCILKNSLILADRWLSC